MTHLEELAALAAAITASGVDDADIIDTGSRHYDADGQRRPRVFIREEAFARLFAGQTVRRKGSHCYAEAHGVVWLCVMEAPVESVVEVTL